MAVLSTVAPRPDVDPWLVNILRLMAETPTFRSPSNSCAALAAVEFRSQASSHQRAGCTADRGPLLAGLGGLS